MVYFRPVVALGALLSIAANVNAVTVRITELGDSLTGGPGCWRYILWQRLQAAGINNTDFVGTQPAGGCAGVFDGEHEGHGGFKATGIVADNQLPGWLAYSQPDIVMMMLGTNDVWNGIATQTIITALSTLVDQMRAQKPSMRILVAKIPPMNPGGCDTCDWPGQSKALGDAIATWAPTKTTSVSPLTVVDCWTGFVAADFTDGVHMTDSGLVKMANCWEAPLKAAIAAFGSVPDPTTSARTSTAVRSSTTSTQATTSLIATTTVRSTTTAARTSTTLVTTTRSSVASSSTASSGGSPLYGQCGGIGYTGPTTCAVGTCKYSNDWYSQCLL